MQTMPQAQTTIERKLERLRHILAQVPGDRVTLMALGEAAFQKGLRLEALQAYQQVLLDGPVGEAHLAIAHLYCHHGLNREALDELQRVFDLEPGTPEAHLLASELSEQLPISEPMRETLQQGCSPDEIVGARSKLNIERSMLIREEQELREIVKQDRTELVYQYYLKETRKKLDRLEELLAGLELLEQARRAREQEAARQRELEQARERELEELRALELAREQAAAEHARAEQERLEAERLEQERLEAERAEQERLEAERAEQERLEAERAELERLEAERLELERLEAERAELERLEAERAELERLEAERTEQERLEAERAEQERIEAERAEQERIEAERAEQVRIEAEQAELERLEAERAELERVAAERAAAEMVANAGGTDWPAETHFVPNLPSETSIVEPSDSTDLAAPFLGSVKQELGADLVSRPYTSASSEEGETAPDFDLLDFEAHPANLAGSDEHGFDLSELVTSLEPDLPPEPISTLPLIELQLGSGELDAPRIDIAEHRYHPVASEGDPFTSGVSIGSGIGSGIEIPILPIAFEPAPEPAPVSVPVLEQTPAGPSLREQRLAAYAERTSELDPLVQNLAKTRGVTSIFLVARDGHIVSEVARDTIAAPRVGEVVAEAFSFLESFARAPQYWVLECAGGIVVLQMIDVDHALVVVGQAGANFGALRYTMDKMKPTFAKIMVGVPPG